MNMKFEICKDANVIRTYNIQCNTEDDKRYLLELLTSSKRFSYLGTGDNNDEAYVRSKNKKDKEYLIVYKNI